MRKRFASFDCDCRISVIMKNKAGQIAFENSLQLAKIYKHRRRYFNLAEEAFLLYFTAETRLKAATRFAGTLPDLK